MWPGRLKKCLDNCELAHQSCQEVNRYFRLRKGAWSCRQGNQLTASRRSFVVSLADLAAFLRSLFLPAHRTMSAQRTTFAVCLLILAAVGPIAAQQISSGRRHTFMDFSAALPRRSLHSAGSIDNKAWEDAVTHDDKHKHHWWSAQAPVPSVASELDIFLSWLGQWVATSDSATWEVEKLEKEIWAAQQADQGVNVWWWTGPQA
ncbi:hypothetical protein WJX73_000752 [Symbiochloris irregularis]|uniref:Uncharacterized protein n=1 Tax=Symbiochloris irregularis TaxID=706552 RepID=A0AAW1PNN7_9CHLO